MNTEKLTWYVARSGGIVAWLLLALGLILGLLLSSRVLGRRASPAWMLSIHRFLGGLSVVFTVVHVAAIMLDDFVSFGWSDVLIPWASEWNPSAVAWGIIATYLAIAIEITSFAMRRLPKGVWRGVHWLSAPLFVLATVHGYQAGTDAGRAFIVAITAVSLVLVALTVVRVVRSRASSGPRTDPRELLEQSKARRRLAGVAPAHAAGPDDSPAWVPVDQPDSPAHAAEPGGTPAWEPTDPATGPLEPTAPRAWTDLDTADPAPPVATSWQDAPLATPDPPAPVLPEPAAAPVEPPRPPDEPFWMPTDQPAFPTEPEPEPEPAFASDEDEPEIAAPPQPAAASDHPALVTEPAFEGNQAAAPPQPAAAGDHPPFPAEPAFESDHSPLVTEPAFAAEHRAFPTETEAGDQPAFALESDPVADEPLEATAPEGRSQVDVLSGPEEPAPAWHLELDTSQPEPLPRAEEPALQTARRREPVLTSVGAAAEPDASAPRPAWSDASELAWVTADAGTDPSIRRREGPVPGVWKRSRRRVGDAENFSG